MDRQEKTGRSATRRLGHVTPVTAQETVHAFGSEAPPQKGLGLGWRLGLTASFIVVVVLGGLTSWQQLREIKLWREDRQELLAESLAPLVAEVESAATLRVVNASLSEFERASARVRHPRNRIDLVDDGGSIVASAHDGPLIDATDSVLTATAFVNSSLLPRGHGKLVLRQDASRFDAAVIELWNHGLLTLGLTVFCLITGLQIANHLLIARPLARLVRDVERMERGYWQGLRDTSGAWEMRWLAYRFRILGRRLEQTVARLVEAERLASRTAIGIDGDLEEAPPDVELGIVGGAMADSQDLRRRLEKLCRHLETSDRTTTATARLARLAWRISVDEGDRICDHRLKTRLENAAFAILQPQTYNRLRRQLDRFSKTHAEWIDVQQRRLCESLRSRGVSFVTIQHRVKQPAAVWRKERSKRLPIEQIQDIVAFRVIVRNTRDCYAALKVIHEHFDADLLRFKDYIAHPKRNGYQSLHTAVRSDGGPTFEIQIRSVDMHVRAERGTAAHWRYSAHQLRRTGVMRRTIPWWRQLLFRLRGVRQLSTPSIVSWRKGSASSDDSDASLSSDRAEPPS